MRETQKGEVKMSSKRVQITLPVEVINDLNGISEKYHISKSNIVSMLVKKYGREEFGSFKK